MSRQPEPPDSIRRRTRFSDVCGTMDELKRLLCEERHKVLADPSGTVKPLLADARSMLDRMEERIQSYGDFRARLSQTLASLDKIEEMDMAPAEEALGFLERCICSREAIRNADFSKMGESAEAVRTVAGTQENRLRAYKDLALKISDIFSEIRGNRPWLSPGQDRTSVCGELSRKYQAWLPPEPHCGKLLDWLAASRAVALDQGGPGSEPLVQFEDGGLIPMSQVRYDPNVENFHPASFRPCPTGRQYRRESP